MVFGVIASLALGQGDSTAFPPGWNHEASRPPMGWRSWNAFGPNINHQTFVDAVNALTAEVWNVQGSMRSLASVGYDSVGIDEGWENCSGTDPNHGLRQHDIQGFPMINTEKFPDMKSLVDYAHSKKTKMGWYLNGCACGERQERLLNYQGDIQRLHEFGFDGAKFDGCGAATNMTRYAALMEKTGKTYMVENCHWGSCGHDAWYKNPDGSSCPTEAWCPFNIFRTSGDINSKLDSWFANLQTTIKFQNRSSPLSVPGCWAYPDMMEVGRIAGATPQWNRAHFGAWCVVSAPLILGLDVTDNKTLAEIIPYITNAEAIAVNQQYAGHPGYLAASFSATGTSLQVQVWAKPQPDGKLAVYVVNPTPAPTPPPAATDPLACFTELPASEKPKNNICFGQYKIDDGDGVTVDECAKNCLADPACTNFVAYHPAAPNATTSCRRSHSCTAPTSWYNMDSYFRKSIAACASGPPSPPPPPPPPAEVSVTFVELGLPSKATRAAVRNVWTQADEADANEGVLHVTVPSEDSAFYVLTPK